MLPGKIFIIDPVYSPGNWGGLPATTVSPDGSFEPIKEAIAGLTKEISRRQSQLQSGHKDFERLTIIFDEVPMVVAEINEAGNFMRRIANFGRHVNVHLIGIGQSSTVNSWGIAGFGDTAENFCTLLLGDKAIQAMPALAGLDHPAVLEWQGKLQVLDLTPIMALAQQKIDPARAFHLPEASVDAPTATEPAPPVIGAAVEPGLFDGVQLAGKPAAKPVELASRGAFDGDILTGGATVYDAIRQAIRKRNKAEIQLATFDESEHPRDHGKFSEKSGTHGAASEAKQPWHMTRQQWEKAGKPVINPKHLENTLKAEQDAINDFFSQFPDAIGLARRGTVEPHPSSYAAQRDEDFAKKINAGQGASMPSKTPLVPRLKAAGAPHNGEDARMAIVNGRRLGYQDADILHYLLNNYVPGGDKVLAGGKPSSQVLKMYPQLSQRNLGKNDPDNIWG